MITKCQEKDLIKGLHCWDETNAVINLHYADDTLIFEQVCLAQEMILKWIFAIPWEMVWSSDQFSKKCPDPISRSTGSSLLPLIFNYPTQSLPITYLGLSLTMGRPKKIKWLLFIEKVRKRLAGWKGRMLSGGRITLINAVFSAIPIYFLSFFPLPTWVEREIDSKRRNFLWHGVHREGKGFCLVNWKWVCKHRSLAVWRSSTS